MMIPKTSSCFKRKCIFMTSDKRKHNIVVVRLLRFHFTETTFTNQGVSFSSVNAIAIISSEFDTSCQLLSVAEADSVTIESSSWDCSSESCIQIHATSLQVRQTSMQALDMDSPVLTPLQIIETPRDIIVSF
eukprot:UN19045